MLSAQKLLMQHSPASGINVADVFSAYPYSGTGAAQSLSPGVDLATFGGLFWSKVRTGGNVGHRLFDNVRGNTFLDTSSTANQTANTGVSLTTSGVSLTGAGAVNASGPTYIGWMFRKAAKFFDVVTYTGNGGSQAISHSLGVTPGMIVIKHLNGTLSNWYVKHRSLASDKALVMNSSAAQTGDTGAVTSIGASSFTVSHGTGHNVNASGVSYVAYVFAHDDSASGIVQCGSTTTDASGAASITLGWQPQYLLWKSTTNAVAWQVADTARGWVGGGNNNNLLAPNSTATETTGNGAPGTPTETGINFVAGASQTLIYMAIRAA